MFCYSLINEPGSVVHFSSRKEEKNLKKIQKGNKPTNIVFLDF